MNWWLILLVAVVALAIVWYIQQQNARVAQRQANDRAEAARARASGHGPR